MPTFSGVRVSQLDTETTTWFTEVLGVIETLDADAYARHMTEDVELRLADSTVLHGREAVATTLGQAWAPLAALVHHEINLYGTSHRFVHEAQVQVTSTDGTSSTFFSTSWIDRDESGLITSARVYG